MRAIVTERNVYNAHFVASDSQAISSYDARTHLQRLSDVPLASSTLGVW